MQKLPAEAYCPVCRTLRRFAACPERDESMGPDTYPVVLCPTCKETIEETLTAYYANHP
ncbi:hypothetical protein I8J29_08980 [Paenibacillus sp. MWE-103]|uniref:Small CPxCG-related zinc finger protein n=1 Tax=Paenibacillus artemisiicola TaxID=1172618 RepID=A0ABS3W826_9BACL|nr:hypothetical protein [Paenibacillus artemisiicola]MBO7744326.1 hypothetical protein [Paenibacillus artemisiicola]